MKITVITVSIMVHMACGLMLLDCNNPEDPDVQWNFFQYSE